MRKRGIRDEQILYYSFDSLMLDYNVDIRDNYPKYVLRTDAFAGGNYEGIKTMHIADFLLSSEY